ncbi:MAG: agmatine deiminase family protein, partial [Prevotella sp.]|nr:agmatine deiminase family protein [Prevotella sp.]
ILDEQTNKVYFSKKIREKNREEISVGYPTVFKRVVNALDSMNVPWGWLEHTKDFWCRDYMPIQLEKNKFIQYRYHPNYLINDDKYTETITDPTETLESLGIETIKTDIIIDGGNVIKCKDCIIMVDKVFSENEQYYSRTELTDKLENLFGCEIIFLPWDKCEPYGHADGIVRYVSDNKVLMTNYHDYDKIFADKWKKILSAKFDVAVLEYKRMTHTKNWAYINFLQTQQAIFVPVFEKEEDEQALEQIEKHYVSYKGRVVPVKLNSIVNKGGALNCISWNILK